MDTAFAQYVASIEVAAPQPVASSSSAASGHQRSKNPIASSSGSSGENKFAGEMHILADITRKLLVVPTHAIGKKRVVEVPTENTDNVGSKPSVRPHIAALSHTFVTDMLMAGAVDGGIISAENPKRSMAAKPSIRIRVSGDDKKSVTSAPAAVRFTLSSNNGNQNSNGNIAAAAGSKDGSKGSVDSHGEDSAGDAANEEDYYANELVDQEGYDDDMDVEN
jgi:hypothetical protein